ncbi:preprotein translocase subunit YajC [Dysgonomonas sp. PH5-45]|uniref:preprotein translocase subunit YajC n=1 Tax=unclassified Dysgonomonas TaxID=2630389 RepID=UPI002472FFF2|nr:MULTISPECIES: preprotein translocase subunit YajC [unclassified Dysgonomonas]MDH6354212.1 preprotein translocase subunit YajC [Dysgonomonas sp. PH5-45]MDH6387113.1 preprotein translocase subunit YajC [Dysgonomonas sp. PH5-37]
MTLLLLLQDAGGGSSMVSTVVMMVAIIAIFYFFMIRPQQKKQKAINQAREALKVGDRIVTAGGFHGKIREIKDTTFVIEIAEGVKVKVEKTSVHPAGTNTEEAASK